ncbi:hypothetical protein QCN29_15660 [Streptomyces sp. HNM0663]|uniref:Uncharacterized protein n=1 Tax=Streptomyces chengmaiensis TaxID=3040919 RepID=A0ABT6HNE5_9ACTN|nr:hypothetical protein [Streptomyces chengmaiensis]MDH2390201.1 hypothetical protein [Streptomyces chengmaiensis]
MTDPDPAPVPRPVLDAELAAVQAYVRLLRTARAVLADPRRSPSAVPLLSAPLAEADEALRAAGLAGNEAEFLRLVAARSGPSRRE